MSNMKNIPEKIYLQIGDECDSEDFNELSEVSWCKDKIYDNDIEYTLQNQMDNITEPEIRNLEDILLRFGEAHNMLAKTSLSKEEYQPISTLLASAKVELFKFYKERKAALQNKLRAEEIELEAQRRYAILEKYNDLDGFMKKEAFKNGAEWYASIVNEKDNIPADFKQVTGHNSPKEMIAYEKGREDEQKVISEWIEQWDGSSNSAMGTLLKKKFDEKKDNVGVNDAIEFADWINKNASRNAVGSWGYFGNMFYTKTSKELYDIFKSESQPQQKEVDGYDDEMPPL